MSTPSLIKQPAENRLYSMDFSGLLAVGETIAGVSSVVATPSGLTLVGSPSYSGVYAMQRISGGTANTRYKVTFVVTTTAGNTLEGEGYLQVKDI
jgi:hypothetical protein